MSVADFPTDKTIGTELRPKRIDIEVYQGDTFKFVVGLKDANGTLIDATGWTPLAQIKKADGSAGETPVMNATVDADGITVVLSDTETGALIPTNGPYKYDVQLTDLDGNVRTFFGGTIIVTEDISE